MSFWQLLLLEGVLLLSSGLVFMMGARGVPWVCFILTVINALGAEKGNFWFRELVIISAGALVIGGLAFANYKAGQNHVVAGLAGGLAGLVLFGAFFSPLGALALWALVMGTGLIPKEKKGSILWTVIPPLLRGLSVLLVVVYGNVLL